MSQIDHFNPSVLTDLNDVIQAAEGRYGLEEHFHQIMDYFLNDEHWEEDEDRDDELMRFFDSLNTNQQAQFLANLLFSVFEDKALAHEPAIIQIRKRISEVQYNIPTDVWDALHLADSMRFEKNKLVGHKFVNPLISYMRSHPDDLRRFLGQFEHDRPQKASAVLKEVILELFDSLPPFTRLAA
ncbi:hypothetical protein JW752_04955 [Candidatus Peregrinibacteria bacterium]|nr:hypothetical protein [Candidatus Peregrinibacteria bacterium]